MIFVDSSAFVSIITGGDDADELADRLQRADTRFCSALSIWETVVALCFSHRYVVTSAQAETKAFRRMANLHHVRIGERETELALDAYARFGKGRHPAGLNMGDCFAYACARANDAKLLFKGEDFTRTDIAAA